MTHKEKYAKACRELGVDPKKLPLLNPTQWRETTGHTTGRYHGKADYKHNVIWIKNNADADVYYHEVLHILFRNKPHWWIYHAAFLLVGITNPESYRYGYGGGQDTKDHRLTEDRATIVRLAKLSAKRKGIA